MMERTPCFMKSVRIDDFGTAWHVLLDLLFGTRSGGTRSLFGRRWFSGLLVCVCSFPREALLEARRRLRRSGGNRNVEVLGWCRLCNAELGNEGDAAGPQVSPGNQWGRNRGCLFVLVGNLTE
jgi:hypothetical protein